MAKRLACWGMPILRAYRKAVDGAGCLTRGLCPARAQARQTALLPCLCPTLREAKRGNAC